MPLLEEMLTDTVQRKKDYLDKLFINGVLEDSEKQNMMGYYFSSARKSMGVPFTGPEEKQDRENFIKHFVSYIRSRGAKPEDRIRAFLPVPDEKAEGPVKPVKWPADVKRNLFLMSYHIAENFEHDQIQELITARAASGKAGDAEDAKKDTELLEKGMLILVKDPATGEYTRYIRATELKAGDTAVPFLPPPTQDMGAMMQQGFIIPAPQNLQAIATGGVTPQPVGVIAQGGVSPQTPVAGSLYAQKDSKTVPDQVSSNDELTKSFQEKRGKAIINQLRKEGLEPVGDVKFDKNGHAMVKVKSGKDDLLVSVDTRVPFDQDLKYTMTFQTGTVDGKSIAGKSFTVDESKLHQAFTRPDGAKREARDVYQDKDLQKQLGIKSDAYPPQAPQVPQPVPTGLPGVQGKPGLPGLQGQMPPIELPGGGGLPPMPGPMKGGVPGKVGGMPFQMPTDYKAPELPQTPQGQGKQGSVGVRIKSRPVPGIPAGSVMDQKAKVAEEQGGGQPGLAAAGGPPVAPGRVGGGGMPPLVPVGGGGEEGGKKKHGLRNVAALHSALIPSFVWGGFKLGEANNADATAVAVKLIKGVWIALVPYLPHLFG